MYRRRPRRKPSDDYVEHTGGPVKCIDSRGRKHDVYNLTKSIWKLDVDKNCGSLSKLSKALGFSQNTYDIGLQLQNLGYIFQKPFRE